jgi:hypothetical protein
VELAAEHSEGVAELAVKVVADQYLAVVAVDWLGKIIYLPLPEILIL